MRLTFLRTSIIPCLLISLTAACVPADDGPVESSDEGDFYSPEGISAWEQAAQDREAGKADTASCSGVVVPDQSGFGGRVALTFDDGPKPETTNKVLDVLKKHDVKATFFINGKRVNSDAAVETLNRIVAEGHILANHSHNHRELKNLDLAEVESEVDRTHQIIEDTGVAPTYFRFPFGSSNCDTADLVRSFGYRVTGWHTDSADWCFASDRDGVGYCSPRTFRHVPDSLRDDMKGLVMEQVQRKNGGIVLFHDVHQNTADNIEGIIEAMVEAEFTFVNIDDVDAFPNLNSADLDDFSWIGDSCEGAEQCDFSADGGCFQYPLDGGTAGFCTVRCEGFCDDFPGRAPTFCVSLDGSTGSCVSKAAPENNDCADIPGTTPTLADRYVGTSEAPARTGTVCVPPGTFDQQ